MIAKSIDCQKSLQILLCSTAILTLTACGGGGGGDNSSSGGAGANFRTEDFNNSSGLDQINAAEGFAQITGAQGGAGVTIAILDDGIDEDHPDLAPNLIDSLFFQGGADRDSTHGTAVAGIAAGAGDNGGIQGVASSSGILAFRLPPRILIIRHKSSSAMRSSPQRCEKHPVAMPISSI